MQNMLKFLVSADDRTDATWRKVTGNLKSIKGAVAGIEDRAKRVAGAFGKWGAGFSAGITAPATLLANESLKLFDIQAKAETAVRQAVASTGGAAGFSPKELFDMASGLQAITTFGDEGTLQNVTTPLLTFTKVAGPEFARAQGLILDMSTALGTDLKSASLQVGKALNDPAKGISALARSGIQFSDEQKDVIKALVKTGQVAKAQGIILDELDTQFGGQAAAAAKVGTAQLVQLGNAIGDVKEQLGAEIAGFLPPLVSRVQTAVDWFAALSPEVKNNIVVIGGLAAAVGPVLAVLGAAAFGVSALAGAFGTLGAVILANPIVAGAAAIGAAAYLIYRNWEPISAFLGGVWDRVTAAIGNAAAWISERVQSITPDFLFQAWDSLPGFFSGLWGRVTSGLSFAWAEIKGLFDGEFSVEKLVFAPWRVIGAFYRGLAPEAVEGIKAIWADIKAEVSTWPDRFFEWGAKIPERLLAGIKSFGTINLDGLFSGWGNDTEARKNGQIQGKEFSAGVADGVNAGLGSIASTAQTLGATLEGETRDYLGINSPSKAFKKIGGWVAEGLALGIEGGTDKVTKAVKKTTKKAKEEATEAAHVFAGPLASAFQIAGGASVSFSERLSNLGNTLLNMVANRALTDFFSTLLNSWGPTKSVGSWLSGSVVANANGNAFSGGKVVPFATGGVVTSPTYFGMTGDNTGLMGEAGPEAIMPLTRIGGKLGVRAQVSGAAQSAPVAANVNVEVHVHSQDAALEVDSITQSAGRIDVFVKKAVKKGFRDGSFDAEMKQFGVRRSAVGA